jgi:prepilin-type N-terminal cleavage/methylation domain-containing protein
MTTGRAQRTGTGESGFTLVELMTVVLIIGALVSIAIPAFGDSSKSARATTCAANRVTTEIADHTYYLQNQTWAGSIGALVGTHLQALPECPSKGVYLWLDTATAQRPARTLGCSVHFAPVDAGTPLGVSFSAITTNMMKLLMDYYTANGHWPSTKSPSSFTDIGLTAADWANPIDHIYYSPSGSTVSVRPESGYVFNVTDTKGRTQVLEYDPQKWLIFSGSDGKWYYKNVTTGLQVDIATFTVTAKR